MSTGPRGGKDVFLTVIAATMLLSQGVCASDDGAVDATAGEGQGLFEERCAVCHDSSIPGIPPRAQLATLPAEYVISALTDGLMLEQAYGLSDEQIRALASYVSGVSD